MVGLENRCGYFRRHTFIAVVALLGMWAMHGSMMGRMSANAFGHPLAAMCSMEMGTPHSRQVAHQQHRIQETKFICREVVSVV